ncbi:MAG: Stealth CR1 domain-containing protein [Muribaculaceae bacterium]|nr:Stealth CR1 domain-containing protein [Muribaculaceae bacterium]MDE5713124.1 Stealth CR1 domain-containing protein [Muribaculaceae bacterium]
MEIDFIVTWVNMDDPQWKEEFAKYSVKKGNEKNGVSDARFRDYGFLKYWFRGIERFAPWVRKIHFVTSGQKPEWLDGNHPKINFVSHKEFIPRQFLPTYNSVVIERYMHRIPGLADHFVYFNDDFYIIRPTAPERFFQNGLPCDIATFLYNPSWSQWYRRIKNNLTIINRHFDKKEVMARDHDKWFDKSYGSRARWNYLLKHYGKFITLRTPHNAQPYLKSTFDEVWNVAEKELTETSANRFRAVTDYTPELFRTWQICRGNFQPYNTYADTKMFPLMIKPKQAVRAIREQSYSLICLNDNIHIRNYGLVMTEIKNAFESILPEKSSFEL